MSEYDVERPVPTALQQMAATCLIELNDAGVRVVREGRVVCESPGVALVEPRQVLAGAAACAQAQVHPRAVHDRFWQELDERPLAPGYRHCRHHADLAYHHLCSVLAACGHPRSAVLAVPSHYREAQLALLLGIANAAGLEVTSLVDGGVAAVAGCAPRGRFVYAELQWHRLLLCAVTVDDMVTRDAVDVIEDAGLRRIRSACGEVAARALLEQTRFDALDEAASAQALHDQLPRWLAQARAGGELRIGVSHRRAHFTATLAAVEFERAIARVLAPLAERPRGDRELLLCAALADLPGVPARFAPAHALPADACDRALREHRAALAPGAGGVAFITVLPATQAPLFAPATTTAPAAAVATHVLAGSAARALGPLPLYLHPDGSLTATAAAGGSCALVLDAARALLRVEGVETRVNGELVTGTREVRPGDHITLRGGHTLFIPISVPDTSAR